ncbi:MAG: hypothetical protein H6713_11685 [Myxococcales bacterium]|nr:hypothetical protein [Myxococcales bacterium]
MPSEEPEGAGAEPGAQPRVADETCRSCHAGKRSARAGHRALAEAGRLRCTTCHNSHARDGGVVLGPGGAARRYDVGLGEPPPRPWARSSCRSSRPRPAAAATAPTRRVT